MPNTVTVAVTMAVSKNDSYLAHLFLSYTLSVNPATATTVWHRAHGGPVSWISSCSLEDAVAGRLPR